MRKPYGGILIVSIILTVLYFYTEERPAYITLKEDQGNMMFFGALYVALLFCIFSGLYLLVKKRR